MSGERMHGWRFSARDENGRTVGGTLQASTEHEAMKGLRAQRLIPLSVERLAPEKRKLFSRSADKRAMTIFTRQFATLIDAALPLLTALDMLAELTDDKVLQTALEDVAGQVRRGQSLSDALRSQSRVFPPLYISMVEAGEAGGTLSTTLETVAAYMEASIDLRDRVRSALVYPAVVLGAAGLAVGVILTFVVPVFSGLFESEGLVLPVGTRILIAASDFMVQWWILVLLALAASLVGARAAFRVPHVRAQSDRVLLGLPLVGELARKAAVARLTRALASMVHSGVILSEALRASAPISGNHEVEAAVLAARDAIQGGSDLSTPFASASVLPELLSRMVKVGEESGRLEDMLFKVAEFYEKEVDAAITGAMKALEPILIVILGVLLGGIIVTMYIPIFDLMTSLA